MNNYQPCKMIKYLCLNVFLFSITVVLSTKISLAQQFKQTLSGIIKDQESKQALGGVSVICETCVPVIGCLSDSIGRFNLSVPVGRHSFTISILGYNSKRISDIHVGTGKEIFLTIDLEEQIFLTEEISIKAEKGRWINPMATVSTRTFRSQDAGRYAAGYFDASRMVNNFAGVSSSNSDDNNDIIIRGNSPRGILWRIEGIEIPNPNHFANGQGSSGGGYSVITTNVLSNFDFFTGSFPAEYGNALSGVMDLNLRSGNSQNREYSAAISVLGSEGSAEGPIGKNKLNSYLVNYRYANFSYLSSLGIIDADKMSIIPKTSDFAFKLSIHSKKTGIFDLFAVAGNAQAGDVATSDIEELKAGGDKDEFIEKQTMAVSGIKHLFTLPDNKTFIRSTLAVTYQLNSFKQLQTDTLLKNTITNTERYSYPAIRIASILNHKFDAQNSLRIGLTFNQIWGDMFSSRLNSKMKYDTLLFKNTGGVYGSTFAQWKHKSKGILETNTGLHIFLSGITNEIVFEPRFGVSARLPGQRTYSLGFGFHSKLEPLSIYSYRVRITDLLRAERNNNLKTSKAFHATYGFTRNLDNGIQYSAELYLQYLYSVPIRETPSGQYSILNSTGGLPDVILANLGKGRNNGLEITVEKSFSKNYYFMGNTSIFNSKYKAPDGKWYYTYFNNNYIFNALGGRHFQVGKQNQNVLSIKLRGFYRGGFRYTPVDYIATNKNKRLLYATNKTYGERLPDFNRLDFGMSYKLNKQKASFIFMADIQNVLDKENVMRRKFEYKNKQVVVSDSKGLGIIPVITIRSEF